jgi:hypothetical protein
MNNRLSIRVFVIAAIASGFLLFVLLPADYFLTHDWDLCPFHRFLGIECFGCGTMRALSALFHGQWARAFAFNPLSYLWVVFGVSAIGYNLAQVVKYNSHDIAKTTNR